MKKQIRRLAVFALGLVTMACGIALSARSGLGISPLNSLAYVLSELTDVGMGYFTMLLYVIYVLLEIPVRGREFRARDLLQVPVAILFGFLVNGARACLAFVTCSNYLQQLACTLISCVLIAAGTVIYVIPDLVCQAPEGLILSVCSRFHLTFGAVKTGFDVTIVVLSVVTGLVFSGTVIGIREGTLIAAVLVGFLTGIFNRTLKPFVSQHVFGGDENA